MDQLIALLVLKIFKKVWDNHFAPQAPAAWNDAVQARYNVLMAAVESGNVPDVDWAKARYLKVNGYVVKVGLAPQQTWTLEEWEALVGQKQAQVERIEEQIAGLPQVKTEPDEMTLLIYNQFIEQQTMGYPEQLAQAQADLAEVEEV